MSDPTAHRTSRSASPKAVCMTALESGRIKALNACNDPVTEVENISVLAFLAQAKKSLSKLRAQMRPVLLAVCDTQEELGACESDDVWQTENITTLRVRLRGRSSLLDTLFDEVISLSEAISGAEIVLSPARRIPSEVLQEIFLFAAVDSPLPVHPSTVGGDSDDHTCDSLSVRSLPWVITFVCRRWRGVATHCPTLWSHIRLQVHKYRNFAIPKSLALNLFLRRSGASLLSVYIHSIIDISEHPVLATVRRVAMGVSYAGASPVMLTAMDTNSGRQ
ncbi:hypothetical protein BDZ89DRAFT_475348 [Hymenopellis radicata]|nr:hypothetical protein BDZ89DRAFT_475348 [Hymenopellis radicata]